MAWESCSVALKRCLTRRTLSLVLRLVPRTNEYSLPRFHIFNAVLAGPYLPKFSYTCFRIVEGWQCLDEVQASIALQLEDAKGQTQPNSKWGDELPGGTVKPLSHQLVCWVWAKGGNGSGDVRNEKTGS